METIDNENGEKDSEQAKTQQEMAQQKARKAMVICDGAEGFLRAHVKDDDYDDYQIAVERFVKDGSEDNALNLIEAAQELFDTAKENAHEKKTQEYMQAQKKREQIREMIDDIIDMRMETKQRKMEKVYETEYETYKMPPDILLKIGCEVLPMIYTAKYLSSKANGNNATRNIEYAIKDSAMIFDVPSENSVYALTRDENNKPSFAAIRKVNQNTFIGTAIQKKAFSKVLRYGDYAYHLTTTSTHDIEQLEGKGGLDRFINSLIDKGNLLYFDKAKSQKLFSAMNLKMPQNMPSRDGVMRYTKMSKKTAQRKRSMTYEAERERNR